MATQMTKGLAAMALMISVCATQASAWTFTETDICRLTYAEDAAAVEITFDPSENIYSITLTRPEPWPAAPTFQLRFDGPIPLIIGTDQHELTDDGQSLSVRDTGFGNVLDGIQYNAMMTALIGDEAVTLSTMTAPDAVEAFRNCPSSPLS